MYSQCYLEQKIVYKGAVDGSFKVLTSLPHFTLASRPCWDLKEIKMNT